ncbi:MAG: N-acetylmuramoyl-L-alanine amidase [Lachnotalea sp.]
MNILLISGHGAGDSGAVSKFGTEATLTIEMVNMIKEKLNKYATVSLYPIDRNAYSDCKNGKLQVDFANYSYVLEVHFNACVNDTTGDGKTTGTEIYVTNAEKTVGVETKIISNLATLGLKNRGVKRTNFTVIARAKAAGASSALLEVCFIDDKDDMDVYNDKKDSIAASVVNAIVSHFKLSASSLQAATIQVDKTIKVGNVVTINSGATYGGLSSTRGKTVPTSQMAGKKHTVDKIQTNKGISEAKLKEINSWVAVSSITLV